MGPMSAEATVVRNYLDWIIALPWKKASRLKKDIIAARAVLDADHYGLEKVKRPYRRIFGCSTADQKYARTNTLPCWATWGG